MDSAIPRLQTYFLQTYGCQMNVYDSEILASLLEARNYQPATAPEQADVVVFNTCGTTPTRRSTGAWATSSASSRTARVRSWWWPGVWPRRMAKPSSSASLRSTSWWGRTTCRLYLS